MAVKYFCDICNREIDNENRATSLSNPDRLGSPDLKRIIAVEVHTAFNGTWNAGLFCKYCIIDAVNKLDDRPRQG